MTAQEFYTLAKLRVDVFVVEQRCVYPEFDGYDTLPSTVHVQAVNLTDKLTAYARLLCKEYNQEDVDGGKNYRDVAETECLCHRVVGTNLCCAVLRVTGFFGTVR